VVTEATIATPRCQQPVRNSFAIRKGCGPQSEFADRQTGKSKACGAIGEAAILVVEDETSIRDLVSLYLSRAGYWVTGGGDGSAAL
jgi:hypothetical protein